jgi:hypothetical protein
VQGWGSKELLDLADKMIFSEGEERLLEQADPIRPSTGTYAADTTFMKELCG